MLKNNKKGFTLVEILVVIILIGGLIAFLLPTMLNVSKNTKKNVLQNKINGIELAAAQWAQTFYSDLEWTNTNCEVNDIDQLSSSSITIPCEIYSSLTVQELIDSKFLTPDEEGEIINPVDSSVMNEKIVILEKYYGNYYGHYQE